MACEDFPCCGHDQGGCGFVGTSEVVSFGGGWQDSDSEGFSEEYDSEDSFFDEYQSH